MPSCGERLGRLDDVAGRVHRCPAGRRVLGQLRQLLGVLLDPAVEVGGRRTRGVLQRVDQLRDDAAQVADQRHVDRPVHADGHRILLDQHPFAVGVVLRPVPGLAVVARLAEFGTQRHAQVGLHHRFDGCGREPVGEGAVLQPGDERRAARGLDHRAGHQVGELLDRLLGARRVNAVAHQQDRALGLADQLRGLGDLARARALIDQSIPARRQRIRDVELFEDDVRRELDVGRSRRAGHRAADRLADDLVGLVGVLDRAAVLDRRREKAFLLDELDAAAPHPPLGDAGPLTAEEDHRRVLHQRAHHRAGDVGHARARACRCTGPACPSCAMPPRP